VTALRIRLLASICAAASVTGAPGALGEERLAISGTLSVAPDLARYIAPGDRLVIKLYHPGDGVELDARYQLVPSFELPLEFHAAPSIDMSGQTKFDTYVIEAFTDKNADVLATAPGELIARTPGAVPLGTTGLQLVLNARRE
jgi:hypothetical protein